MIFDFGFPVSDWRREGMSKASRPTVAGFGSAKPAARAPVPAERGRQSETKSQKSKNLPGFTLLELLLSLALVGLLMAAMNQFIFSMGELWGRGADVRLFDQHVRAVTRFVEQTLEGTAVPTARGVQALAVQDVRLPDGPTSTLLTFELPAGSRVFPWPEAPLPDVVCALGVRQDQGLVIYWHSRLEQHFADEPPRATVLTPLVTGLSYDYYNASFNSWQNYQTLQRDNNGQWKLPTRLHLHFTYQNMTRDTVVTVPATTQALPFF
jgi:prepilin-type N-terminal cleavage/methylation domain-containing protein